MAAGEQAQFAQTITVQKPGYYRVVVGAVQRSAEPGVVDGQWVRNADYRELWLLIDERGGRLVDTFNPALLPDSVARQPGVYRLLRGSRARQASSASTPTAPREPSAALQPSSASSPQSASSSPNPRRIAYYNYDIGDYQGIPGVTVTWEVVDAWNNVTQSYYGVTDAEGHYAGPCILYPGLEFAPITYYLENDDVRIIDGNGSVIVESCESTVQSDYAETNRAWMFARYNEFIPFSRALLNVSRGRMDVRYDPNLNGAYYTASPDRITHGPSTLFYQYGRFTVAHEYGHAIHAMALGGIAGSGSCPAPHYLNGYYNVTCALVEGFADFVGATAQNVYDVGTYYLYIVDYTNKPWYTAGADGSTQEAAAAALMYDLTDSDGGDGGASEPWDGTLGERVPATIRDCRLRLPNSTITRVRGTDDLVYCAERFIDATVRNSFFQTRPTSGRAQAITANATASPYWVQSNVRQVWRKNLYGLD